MPEDRVSYGFPLPEGEVCPTGSFRLSLGTGRSEWSEGLYRIHGYTRGEVVPTTELVLAHKHPDDRDAACQFIQTWLATAVRAPTFTESSMARAVNTAS